MTTGSYTMDAFTPHSGSGSWTGVKGSKNWSGADRPKVAKTPNQSFEVSRRVYNRKTRSYEWKVIKVRSLGFRPKRVKSSVPNSYSMNYSRLEQLKLIKYPDGRSWPDLWLIPHGSWTNAGGLLDANDQINLVGKLSEKIKGSDFNMSVFLGELPETIQLLADTAIRIRKAVVFTRRGDLSGAARTLFENTGRRPLPKHDWSRNRPFVPSVKTTGSKWLELQYGWLPLLKDAESAAQSLAHALQAPCTQRYAVTVRRETNASRFDTASYPGVTIRWVNSKSHRRGLIAYISEKPSWPALLGLLDPELVAWELLPFSFIADWFIPIGPWMEARALASRLTGTFVTSDKRTAFSGRATWSGLTTASSSSSYRQVSFSRSVSSTLDVPMPVFKSLSRVASWQHCTNALALMTGVFDTRRSAR